MQYMEIADRCRQAAGIVAQGWCQNESAIDSIGMSVDPADPSASRFCLTGVLDRFPELRCRGGMAMVAALVGETTSEWILWNDAPERTQADVVAKLHEIADAAELKAYEVGEVADPPVVVIHGVPNAKEKVT